MHRVYASSPPGATGALERPRVRELRRFPSDVRPIPPWTAVPVAQYVFFLNSLPVLLLRTLFLSKIPVSLRKSLPLSILWASWILPPGRINSLPWIGSPAGRSDRRDGPKIGSHRSLSIGIP